MTQLSRSLVLVGSALALALGGGIARAADTNIWIEGESAKTKQLGDNSWYNSVKKGALSGGAWASNWSPDKDGLLDFDVSAPADGDYTLWVRANPIGATMSVKINEADWKPVDLGKNIDNANIADNDAPDMRFIAWVNTGKATLKKGANAVSFKMTSGNNHCGALDCFLFTTSKSFIPAGSAQPGKKLGLADPGTWAFEPDADDFDPKSLLDLRSLNEKKAGESGWVTRTADGDFALGNGKPVRFWAVNDNVFEQPDEALKTHARFLAKRGVNMVRFHGHFQSDKAGSKITDVNDDQIDKCQRLVAAMKEEGIYTTVSPFWATSGSQASWEIPGHPGGAMFGLVFWDETTQKGYKAWIKELLTRKNPHGAVPLGQEPALGIFQIQNEDSLLFWTLGTVKGEEKKRLCKHQGDWAAKKYGSLDKAKEAWDGTGADGDDFANGQVGIVNLWEYNADAGGGKGKRLADQLEWLSETMHDFNQMVDDYVHKELGCKVLINAGNWRTANQVKMLDAERWSYSANQVMGVNRYVDFVHINPTAGEKAGYLVSRGDFFEDKSCLLNPRTIPTSDKQVVGFPFIISESTWVPPIQYASEGPMLVAAYSSLSGVDTYYWFALGSVGYDRTIGKWQAANPAMMGGWPAASLLFRKGYVKKGEPAVHEERALEDVWKAKGIIIAEDEGFDPNRDSGSMPKESNVKAGANPLAFLVGPVEVVYGGDPKKSKVVDFAKYIDDGKKTVTSDTGELMLDHGKGYCTMDAPKAQGATGFLSKAGTITLKTMTIDSANDYATYMAVPLDDKELKDSQKILLQATTICRPHGWKQTATEFQDGDKHSHQGFRIDDTGSEPWNVANAQATIGIKNAKLTKATQLDANGMALKEIPVEAKGGTLTIKLPADALYIVLQ